jgi:hypothetical protein
MKRKATTTGNADQMYTFEKWLEPSEKQSMFKKSNERTDSSLINSLNGDGNATSKDQLTL